MMKSFQSHDCLQRQILAERARTFPLTAFSNSLTADEYRSITFFNGTVGGFWRWAVSVGEEQRMAKVYVAMHRNVGADGDWILERVSVGDTHDGMYPTLSAARTALSGARARGYATRIICRSPAAAGNELLIESSGPSAGADGSDYDVQQ